MMKENTKIVFKFLQANNGAKMTAADIAAATGVEKKSVDGIFTQAIQKKGYGVRTEAEIELADGTHKPVKFLSLTAEGMAFDVDAAE